MANNKTTPNHLSQVIHPDLAYLLRDDILALENFPRQLDDRVRQTEQIAKSRRDELITIEGRLMSLKNLRRLVQWASKPTPVRKKNEIPGVGLDIAVVTCFVVLGVANLLV